MVPCPIIDTHCHLDAAAFNADRDLVLRRARQGGVYALLIPAVAANGWPALLACCDAHAGLYPALGLHPMYCGQHGEADLDGLRQLIKRRRPTAIGEIGLDFFRPDTDRLRQQQFFEQQLIIAAEAGLPVILHVRKAHNEVISRLQAIPQAGGIVHAFNGGTQQADKYIELGFVLGFGGMLTYERSRKLRNLARDLPLTALVLETDAPDLTVASHRGERNSPEYLPECLAALAKARGEDPVQVAQQTSSNAERVLGIRHLNNPGYHDQS